MTVEPTERPWVVVVCAGEGAAVEQLVRALPPQSGIACIVTCDESPGLVEALRGVRDGAVIELRERTVVEPDKIYVVSREQELVIDETSLVPVPATRRGKVDVVLRAVADSFGSECAAVILSGRGGDGQLGIKRVKEAGGFTIAQAVGDEPEGEMPRQAIATGAVDLVAPVREIAARLVQLGSEPPPKRLVEDPQQASVGDALRDILAMVRIRTGHDFSGYKRGTLFRRVARRMQVCQTETVGDYHRYLREHNTELAHLLRDFLISVTNFFRDSDAFDALAQSVIPRLFKGRPPSDQVRVWVAGCATGEEAYSLGMLLAEHASTLADPPSVQIFATDIDEESLIEARAGVYPLSIETDVSRLRLERFFVRQGDSYRISQQLREMVLFSPHNVLRDPPFSRLDLVSSRNMLIYLNRDAQERVLATFHFALRPDGFLFLGSSESADSTPLFGAYDAKQRIFQRRLASSSLMTETFLASPRWAPTRVPPPPVVGDRPAASFGELHHRIVEHYAPPSVLVNEELDVVHISEHAGRFLEVQGGEPTRQILRMVLPALRFELRGAIYSARNAERGSSTRVVRFDDGGRPRAIDIRVRKLEVPELASGSLLILFDELDDVSVPTPPEADPEMEPVVREMEDELHRTREQLRVTIEQYETSLEELKASNEELHAINEELRSATEELETSKEELQSVNEELTTLNHELNVKVDEVSRINSDLQNLIASTDIGVLFLDRELRVKRFTPRVQELFNVIAADIGRPFSHLTHRLEYDDLQGAAEHVLSDLRGTELELTSRTGARYLARFLPYRSLDDRIEGVVMTFVEVTKLRHAEEARDRSEAALRTAEERLSVALKSAPVIVFLHDARLAVTWAYVQGQEKPRGLGDAMTIMAPDQQEQYLTIARRVLANGRGERAEVDVELEGVIKTFDFRIEPGQPHRDTPLTAVGFDITPSKVAERELREADHRKDEFLATLSHELRNPLTPLLVAFDALRMSTTNPAEHGQLMEMIDRQLHALSVLVDELLDLSRVTHGKVDLDIQPVPLARLLENALQSVRPLIDEARHSVKLDVPPGNIVIPGDQGRLTQIITNLLSNAVKYTPPGGTIGIGVEVLRDRAVRLTVSDNGVGIEPELLPRLFEIFVQSRDERGRSRGGLGIGLNLVRRLVELHGGTVEAHSDGKGRGSRFVVELPLQRDMVKRADPDRR
jgi:two-component system CheB/CheR fusion protein